MTAVTLLIMVLGLLAPVLFLLVADEPVARVVMLTLALPGLAGGYAVTYASALGVAVSGLGMLPAAVATILLAVVFARRREEGVSVRAGRIQGVLVVVLVCTLTAAMAVTRYSTVFHEEPGAKLTARVEGGPWGGLMTTPERKLMVESLDRDAAYLISPGDRVYCTGWIPGAYLAANARVGAFTIQGTHERVTVSAETPMFVIEDRYWWPEGGPDDPFKRYLRTSGLEMLDETPWYRIYKHL